MTLPYTSVTTRNMISLSPSFQLQREAENNSNIGRTGEKITGGKFLLHM